MKMHKKISIVTLIVLIFTTYLAPLTYGVSSDELIYEDRSSKIITSGVTHNTIKRFLTSGWLNINIVTVDLTNPYVKLDLLTPPEGVSALANVKTMAESSNAVAAINGGFFDKFSTESGSKGGYPMGFEIKSGNIVSTPFYVNKTKDKFATFSMDKLNQVFYSYVKQTTALTAPSGAQIKVSDINKISTDYKAPVMFNKYWGKYSIGSNEKFPNMTEMVVNNGVVTEIRYAMPSVEIPENGYVITSRQEGGKSLSSNFKVDDAVQLNIKTTPDLSNQEFAVSGGTILLKDGHIYPFTHDITGLHPRSSIGTSKDNKYLYMVAVDGRQTLSRGVTQQDLANIMLEIGAYNAINLDGGGSTTLVERLPGTTSIGVTNSPSEAPLRKVVDALGVISIAPPGTLKGFNIETADDNIFVNTKRKFSVKGYDEFYNPVQVNPEQVSWKISGVKGSFEKDLLTVQEVGEATVTATVDNISKSIPVSILSSPVEITISPRIAKTSIGKQVSYTVKGKNKNGYYAVIDPLSLKWSLSSQIGELDGKIFTANSQGSSIVSCSINNVTAFGGISVSGETTSVIQPCEDSVAAFKGYPAEVTGELTTANELKHSGLNSYKLSYDFTETDSPRAAYAVFPDKSIVLGENSTDLGVWVYNSAPKSEWLKAQITDSEGSAQLINLTKDLSWTGWKYIKVPLDEDLSRPAQLSRIYVVQVDPAIKSTGEIYIDDLTLYSKKVQALDSSKIPVNITLPDSAQQDVSFKSGSNSFRFAVLGKISPTKTLLDKIYLQKFTQKLENNVQLSALVGKINNDFYKSMKIRSVTATGGNSSSTYKNSTFITLDNTKDGLRNTNSKQWKWFFSELEKIRTNNVFILLPESVDNFSDPYEAKLFNSILTDYRKKTKRNVWVITGGSSNNVTIEKGIRNISSSGLDQSTSNIVTSIDKSKYILVTVKGSEITYQIKSLF